MRQSNFRGVSLVLFALFGTGALCSDVQAQNVMPYPEADEYLGEKIQDFEEDAANTIGTAIESGLERRAQARKSGSDFEKARPYIRDAHPKAHGCVKAQFRVWDERPNHLAAGVFAQKGKSYCSWVRFSNSNENPRQADGVADGRGMAIKLLNVPGESLLQSSGISGTQDFIMISHPVFFINDAQDYARVVQEQNKVGGPSALKLLGAIGLSGAIKAAEITRLKNRNPFEGQYWSMVPYQLGQGADRKKIKFKSQPCGYEQLSDQDKRFFRKPEIPKNANRDFLRQAVISSLETGQPCMELLIQVGTSEMSVEDSKTEWDANEAPFEKVAELTFPTGQNFNTTEQNLACEDMSFSPWHGLKEHKPLGALNRIRKIVYHRISNFRHEKNMAPHQEPPSFEQENCINDQWK